MMMVLNTPLSSHFTIGIVFEKDSGSRLSKGPIFIPPACPLMSELVCFWVAKSGSGFLKAPFSCHPPVLALQGWYSF